MENAEPRIYEFGDFRLEAGRRLLLGADGRPVQLTPKAFDTLLYLLQHNEKVVEKETLMRAIWPDTIVEENNLNQSISTLRRVLGGKRSEHRYIVTLPGRGYRFVATIKKQLPPATAISAKSLKSLAVLPFQPLVQKDSDPSLEMGMADTLIARLSGVRDVVVRPLSSVRKYAEQQQDALQAGRELGVESVLEGSLQRRGNRIRVNVRLLDVSNGASLWAGTFNEEMTDIFELQDAISEKVVQALALELSREDKTHLAKRDTENTKAYQLYLKGRYYWWNNSPKEYNKGRDYFHRAVKEDPSYALGYCGLNSYYGYGAAWGFLRPEEGWPKAEWAITRALELDDTLAEAHLGLAALKMVCHLDWAGTEKETKRAIELNPRFDEIHYMYSFFLVMMRRFEEAIAEGRRALVCNPFSIRISQHLGFCFYCAGKYDDAIRQYEKTLELDLKNAAVHEAIGDVLERKGEHEEATKRWHKALTLAGDNELAKMISSFKAKSGQQNGLRAVALKRLERLKKRKSKGEYVPAMNFAHAYLRMGDQGRALGWLKQACEERNVYSLMIGCDPLYDSLRTVPEFNKLLKRIKLSR